MNFCEECDSMLLPEQIDNKLWLKCSECGYKEQNKKTIIETKNYKSKDTVLIDNNKYLIYDNTLPNSMHKECPNKNCLSRVI